MLSYAITGWPPETSYARMNFLKTMIDKPLVTIILFTYNQQRYVADAVHSILAQDYTPVQIIISDDCSSDNTFELTKSIVDNYEGNGTVILNRNVENLGIGRHVNKLMEMAEGELIFAAAGDDISMPTRVSDTVKIWLENDRKPLSMCTKTLTIDENGDAIGKLPEIKPVVLEKVMQLGGRWIYGASHAWHRSLFDDFGPLRDDVVSEDKSVGFRSLLLGQDIFYIEKPLVKYRFHAASVTTGSSDRRKLEQKISSINSYIHDFEIARSKGNLVNLSAADTDKVYGELVGVRDDFTLRHKILTSGILSSLTALFTAGSLLTFAQKKRLLVRRLKGIGE